jgi:diketogulonate reductase-like aldo/keto reductase
MRLIDTARVYNVEEQVGRGIKKSGVPREEIFLGTKLWCHDYHPEDVERALDDSLRDLDTPYVDLLLMHYPCTFKRGPERFPRDKEGRMIKGETGFLDTWRAMEKLTETGKVKAIGVSNFSKGEIEVLLNESSTVSTSTPVARYPDSILTKFILGPRRPPNGSPPLPPAKSLQRLAQEQRNPRRAVQPARQHERFLPANGVVQGNCAHDAVIDQPLLKEIAKKHDKSPAQVVLAWGINSGRSVIPKSVVDWQIDQNLEADFELAAEDMERIATLDAKARFNDPSLDYEWRLYSDLEGIDGTVRGRTH